MVLDRPQGREELGATNGQRLRTWSHVRNSDDLRPLLQLGSGSSGSTGNLQHYAIVVVERILNRASPKHLVLEVDQQEGEDANQRAYKNSARGENCQPKGLTEWRGDGV